MIVRLCMFCMRFARAYSVTLSKKKEQKQILDLKDQVLICCVGIWAQYIQFALRIRATLTMGWSIKIKVFPSNILSQM